MAKLLGYSFQVEWIPGKNHHIADCLSRNSVFAAQDRKDIIIQQVTEVIMDEALGELSKVAKGDKDYQEVVTAVCSGTEPPQITSRTAILQPVGLHGC